jgi:excisionase family DNA binding protein
MTQDTLMTTRAVAVALGVSTSTVRRLAESGELPHLKFTGITGIRAFEASVVQGYLRERAEEAQAAMERMERHLREQREARAS